MRLMSRTGFAGLAVVGAALLAGATPALADSGTPAPVPTTAGRAATPAPSEAPSDASAMPTTAPAESGRTPSTVPSQVGVVPRGGAGTGVGEPSSEGHGALIGGAAAASAAAGVVFHVVRRRRASGA
ncbi:hypothetical protein QF032_005552 [Streptomyces achromogenes]|nr:hypothetical protein [Streptomyces achromogenes]